MEQRRSKSLAGDLGRGFYSAAASGVSPECCALAIRQLLHNLSTQKLKCGSVE